MFRKLIERFLPDTELLSTLLLPVFAVAFLAALLAAWLKRKGVRTPYTRKSFHFMIFSFAGILQYYYGLAAVTLLGLVVFTMVVIAVIAGDKWWFYKALARETDAPHQKKFILLPLLATTAGGIVSNIFFSPTAYIGYFVGGWGDAIGEPVGTRWGKHRYTVPTLFGVRATRSVEGSSAVMLLSTIIATACVYYSPSFNAGFGSSLLFGVICGVGSAVVEAASSHGLDNFTMQVTAAAIIHGLVF